MIPEASFLFYERRIYSEASAKSLDSVRGSFTTPACHTNITFVFTSERGTHPSAHTHTHTHHIKLSHLLLCQHTCNTTHDFVRLSGITSNQHRIS